MSIYIAPFKTGVQEDDIVSHILGKTEISPDLFIVEKLVGKHEDIQRKTFVSFKISTFNSGVFNAILNDNIWGPHQSARPFDNAKLNKPNFNNNNNNRRNETYNYQRQSGNHFRMSDQNKFGQQNRQTNKKNRNSPVNINYDNVQRNDRGSQRYLPYDNINERDQKNHRQNYSNLPPRFQNQTKRHQQVQRNDGYSDRDDYRQRSNNYYGKHFAESSQTHNNNTNNNYHSQQRQRRNSYQQSFLDPDDYQSQSNPFRMNNNNRQYGSKNSIYRV